jgi:hypothetical protein
MKLPPKRLYVVLQIIFFCLVTANFVRAAEPAYDGRSLSEWLFLNSNPSFAEHYLPTGSPSPTEAIRQIGTNGIPTMMNILSMKKSDKWWELRKLKSPLVKKIFGGSSEDLDDLRSAAVGGFAIPGTNAECAIPQLTKLFHRYDNETFFQTIRALNAIGPKGFSVLTNSINDPDPSVRNNVIWVIGEEGSDSKLVTQLLVNALKDPEASNRGNAADFLAGKDPSVAIPALISVLDDKEYYPLVNAAGSLASYGPAAKIAAPKLLSLYTNVICGTNQFMIKNLTVLVLGDLRKIDPPTAGKAEQFMIDSGPLNGLRYGYTTTLLPNGKQLIVGGFIHTEIPVVKNRTLAYAELLDPSTGKWSETGKMHFPRYDHQAVLQSDGKVLVTGGYDERYGQTIPSNELYDPDTGIWSVITNK